MKKLFGKNKGEEHNFWMSYTDLMSGFLIVFILASLLAYKEYHDIIINLGGGTSGEVKVKLEEYNKIKEIQRAIAALNSEYYVYNEEFQRFECKIDIMFAPNDPIIPSENWNDFKKAGKELVNLLDTLKTDNVAFKIIIEGRAANSHTKPMTNSNEDMKLLSYKRALELYKLWQKDDILKNLNNKNAEVFISGSGLEGKGRYKGLGKEGEDRNKRFIIQIVPYLKFNHDEDKKS
jgi:hypothetical protein